MDDVMSNIFPLGSFPRNAARALDPFRERHQRRLASTSKEFVSDVERLCEVVVVVRRRFHLIFCYPVRVLLSFAASEIRLSYKAVSSELLFLFNRVID